jgi:hypothetical protein
VNPANRMKIPNRFPHQSNTVLIVLLQICTPMLRAYKFSNVPKQQQFIVTSLHGMMGGGFLLNNKKLPSKQQIHTTPYMFVFQNNSILINIL